MIGQSFSVALLGRDRSPFLPDVVWLDHETPVDRRTDPKAWQEAADADSAVVTQWDDGTTEQAEFWLPTCSASVPTLVKRMLDACDVREGHRVLEIGTGTGFTAALLKDRVGASGTVVSIEVDPVLAADARARLAAAGVDAEVRCADGLELQPDREPFDRVHVTCGIRRIPSAWLVHCPDGKIVMPWGPLMSGSADREVTLAVHEGVAIGDLCGPAAFFMAARTQRERLWYDWPDTGETTKADFPVTGEEIHDLREIFGGFVMGLLLPGVTCQTSGSVSDGDLVVWLERAGVYASLGFDRDEGTTVAGDPDLADDCTEAVRWWHDNGRPSLQAFGLRVTADGEFARQDIWFGTPDRLLSTWLTAHRRATTGR